MIVLAVLVLCGAACSTKPPPRYASADCVPRAVDEAPICGVPPSAADRVKRFALNGPETGGDQMQLVPICGGLLLELEYESGAVCKQRIASFSSIGILAADGVYVDDRAVCFHIAHDALEIRRDDAVVARVPRPPGVENAPSFPLRCID